MMSSSKFCLFTLQLAYWFGYSFHSINDRLLGRFNLAKISDPFDSLDRNQLDSFAKIYSLESTPESTGEFRNRLRDYFNASETSDLTTSAIGNTTKKASSQASKYFSSLAKAKRLKGEKRVTPTNNVVDEKVEILTMTLLRNSYRSSILNEVKADIIAASKSFLRLRRVSDDLLRYKTEICDAKASLVQQLVDYRKQVTDDILLRELDIALAEKKSSIIFESENIEILEICLGVLDIEIGKLVIEQQEIDAFEQQVVTTTEQMDNLLQRVQEAKESRVETVDALIRQIGKVQAVASDAVEGDFESKSLSSDPVTVEQNIFRNQNISEYTVLNTSTMSSVDASISPLDTRSDTEIGQKAAVAAGKTLFTALKGALSAVATPIAYVLSDEGKEVREASVEALQAVGKAAKALSTLILSKSSSVLRSGSASLRQGSSNTNSSSTIVVALKGPSNPLNSSFIEERNFTLTSIQSVSLADGADADESAAEAADRVERADL